MIMMMYTGFSPSIGSRECLRRSLSRFIDEELLLPHIFTAFRFTDIPRLTSRYSPVIISYLRIERRRLFLRIRVIMSVLPR